MKPSPTRRLQRVCASGFRPPGLSGDDEAGALNACECVGTPVVVAAWPVVAPPNRLKPPPLARRSPHQSVSKRQTTTWQPHCLYNKPPQEGIVRFFLYSPFRFPAFLVNDVHESPCASRAPPVDRSRRSSIRDIALKRLYHNGGPAQGSCHLTQNALAASRRFYNSPGDGDFGGRCGNRKHRRVL